jgi:rhomboid protease GluP
MKRKTPAPAAFASQRGGDSPRDGGEPPYPLDSSGPAGPPDDSAAAQAETPYVTIGLLVVITVIFLAMLYVGHGDVIRVSLLFGAKENSLVRQGQYWRLVTPIFLHGGWLHLLVNGYSLYRLGGSMERIYGAKKYFLIFLFAGITGNTLSYLLSPSPSLGASGALFGLVGAGLVFPIRFRNLIPADVRNSILRQLFPIAAINLAIGFSLHGIIDNWAHIGGLLGGAFIALFLIPDVLEAEPRPALASSIVTALVLLSIGVVVASWAYQWSWAHRNPPVTLLTYYPATGVPWWSITVPARWRYMNGQWTAPNGATLRAAEHLLADPSTGSELLALLRAGSPLNSELDGKPAWSSMSPTRMQYRVPVHDRLFELTIEHGGRPLTAADRTDFAVAAASLRFVRSPPLGAANAKR